MDFATFKAQLEAARRIEHAAGGITFQINLPTEYQKRVAFEDHRDLLGRVEITKAFRVLVARAVTGWSGAKQRHFAAEGSDEAVAFSEDARDTLLEIRQDLCDELGVFISARLTQRQRELGDASKN